MLEDADNQTYSGGVLLFLFVCSVGVLIIHTSLSFLLFWSYDSNVFSSNNSSCSSFLSSCSYIFFWPSSNLSLKSFIVWSISWMFPVFSLISCIIYFIYFIYFIVYLIWFIISLREPDVSTFVLSGLSGLLIESDIRFHLKNESTDPSGQYSSTYWDILTIFAILYNPQYP
jgi:hypothetical protein